MVQEIKKAIEDGLYFYSFIVSGKGRLTGEKFAEGCAKIYSTENYKNAVYYALFKKYLLSVEVKRSGIINASIKNPNGLVNI